MANKEIFLGKHLPFFCLLTVFRVTSLSMVTVLLGYGTAILYSFLLLLLTFIEGIIGSRKKHKSIFSFWKKWMNHDGKLCIISHGLTSITSVE